MYLCVFCVFFCVCVCCLCIILMQCTVVYYCSIVLSLLLSKRGVHDTTCMIYGRHTHTNDIFCFANKIEYSSLIIIKYTYISFHQSVFCLRCLRFILYDFVSGDYYTVIMWRSTYEINRWLTLEISEWNDLLSLSYIVSLKTNARM